ncbi:oxidoreductase [Mycobacterium sp. 852013-51886_SCH5428379]|uniref:carboxylic acid reductase n=1 Tax=Mycobacterium sp. 852013-51886_SCH5428379 TaxID=1834111 RepID=UPI00080178D1|nr:carboxylic acid reductase [Mycobacterium sp. 852013-51886_SCH5428379]OBB59891.1 oxidoreductase [Mycobacterium sp. 852013-51886_SCH5428379]
MSTSYSPDGREARLDRRIADLYASDPQFAAARPDPVVGAAVDQPGLRLHDIVRAVMEAYAERPALGRRAVEYVTDAAGRTSAELLPRFDTITYRETWDRVRAVAAALADRVVRPGDRVAVLGFTSVDYTIIDMALNVVGAVAVPLQTSAAVTSLQPILVETEPVALFAAVDFLDDAVDLARTGFTPRRLVVFDHDARVDADREAVTAAASALSSAGVAVESLTDVIARGRTLPAAAPHIPADPDPLMLLVYTSGSTGTPKGAMYPERLVANSWRTSARQAWGQQSVTPAITLSFMPMSHMMGRGILYAALAAGGTVYFAARSDLSTFLEDVALVRPTQMNFVPRIWEMLFQEAQSRIARDGTDLADLRSQLVGDRGVSALTGSAPISPELKAWVEDFLDLPLIEGYGSTEAGGVFVDGHVRRPPVRDYKLVDVPDLGYFHTDRPFPRGELLVKSDDLIPGYYRRPEITAEVFDEDGYYRTGDIVAETGPDQLKYLDRRNNVLKLSQGEFVAVSTLEAVFGASPLVRQIYLYGNSARSYLLAVVVPTEAALERSGGDDAALRAALSEALLSTAREAGLQSYEIPRDLIVETEPFTLENGLLTGIRKLARPKLKERYGPQLEQLYTDLADDQAAELRAVREGAQQRPVLETVSRAAAALLGAAGTDVRSDAHFTDLGGDSLSALTFGNLLNDVFDIDVPVGVIVSPANDLAAIAGYIEAQRSSAGKRPTYDSVHGRDATVVRARDLTLDKFIDAETLSAATALPAPTGEVRTVLLTGATGFLGRYLALDWLERMSLVGGKVVCLVRAKDDAAARQRLDDTFDSGDPKLLEHYRRLSEFLEVLAGDKGDADLGLPQPVWRSLAETVDLIVDPAALVNHVLPYRQLFGPNALGTAELIRLALTAKLKPFTYVSTIGVGAGVAPGRFIEDGDVREISPTRAVDDSYANGYGNSKWAGEVLLREAHDLCGLPVAVFRCDMILADTTYAGQLNLPDMFTRTILSLVATGIAPESFYELDEAGRPQRAHYDGLPVEFIAEAIDTLGAQAVSESGTGFATFHVMNPYDDGIGLDQFVDWLVDAGYRIDRVAGYDAWLTRFETAVRALPERQRQYSLLPLLHNYRRAERPLNGAMAPTERFRAAVQEAKIGPDKDIPHVTPPVIVKYATDLELLGLL